MKTKYYVRIDRSTRESVVRKGSGDWDYDDISEEHDFHGFSVSTDERNRWDFILNENPNGKDLFLIVAFYDTGDSFHREYNKVCLIHLTTNHEAAQDILKALAADYKRYQEKEDWDCKPIQLKLLSGEEVELYTGTWKGYFEKLKELRVIPLGGGSMSVRF